MFSCIRTNKNFKPIANSCKLIVRELSIVSFDSSHITVDLGKDKPEHISFLTVFLRDACQSSESVDASSKQKRFSTAQIAKNLRFAKDPVVIEIKKQPCLQVVWEHDDGTTIESTYIEAELRKYSSFKNRMSGKFFRYKQKLWTNSDLIKDMKNINVDYYAYLSGDETFRKTVEILNKYGLCFVNGIESLLCNPQSQTLASTNSDSLPLAKLAKKFGYIKETLYGRFFDVKVEQNAKNIAYTDEFLPLHMDLCYYESPPGLQLLHFIQNSTTGGENVFADSFLAAKHVKETDSEAYEALKTVPITFHYNNNNEYYYYLRPLIVEDPYVRCPETGKAQIKEVNYSSMFQGPFEHHVTRDDDPALFDSFLRGMRAFEDFVNDKANQYMVKIPENTCIIFDNRRILHSRLEFSTENGGSRWVMGCYVDGDSFRSKLRTLHQK